MSHFLHCYNSRLKDGAQDRPTLKVICGNDPFNKESSIKHGVVPGQ